MVIGLVVSTLPSSLRSFRSRRSSRSLRSSRSRRSPRSRSELHWPIASSMDAPVRPLSPRRTLPGRHCASCTSRPPEGPVRLVVRRSSPSVPSERIGTQSSQAWLKNSPVCTWKPTATKPLSHLASCMGRPPDPPPKSRSATSHPNNRISLRYWEKPNVVKARQPSISRRRCVSKALIEAPLDGAHWFSIDVNTGKFS
jgi:hypothetical protein